MENLIRILYNQKKLKNIRCLNYFYILALILVISHCTSKRDDRYYSSRKDFSIKFPKEWEVIEKKNDTSRAKRIPDDKKKLYIKQNTSKNISNKFPKGVQAAETQSNSIIIAYIPDESKISYIKQNINVVVEELDKPIHLSEYTKLLIDNLKMLKGIKIYEKGITTINNYPAHWFIYSYTLKEFGYKAIVYVLCRDNGYYVITGISEYTNFSRHEPIFKKITRSFHFE